MSYKIYKHTLPDGRAYIGMTKQENLEKRWKYGWGYQANKPFFEEIMKFGWNNIKHEVLEEVETFQEAHMKEIYYIVLNKTYEADKGFNIHGKGKIKTKKAYLCEETGDIFNSQRECGLFCNRTRAAISLALKENRAINGYHFKQIEISEEI